jgi:hypothetical protein
MVPTRAIPIYDLCYTLKTMYGAQKINKNSLSFFLSHYCRESQGIGLINICDFYIFKGTVPVRQKLAEILIASLQRLLVSCTGAQWRSPLRSDTFPEDDLS